MYDELFASSLNLAKLIFEAAHRPTFVSFIEADITGRDALNSLTCWAGGVNKSSRAPMFGPWKAYSLLARGALTGVTTTPIYGFKEGCKWHGGVREDSLITSCSGWENDFVDLMLALLLQWSLIHEVLFHHIGYRYTNDEERRNQMGFSMEARRSTAISSPTKDHNRYFIEVPTSKSENGVYWIEYQSWPTEVKSNGLHWDFATTNPEGLIQYIGQYSGLPIEIWPREKNSPCAMVHAFDKDGTDIAIMARPEWTNVRDW